MNTPDRDAAEILVFAGPSCRDLMRGRYAAVGWRAPAEAGDMLRLLSRPPRCVVIIDGLFDQRPAVRHKEILLLLSQGVHVLGAASMGALRAAELRAFGMTGVGRVYHAYVDGRLTGDDEVALMHGPQDYGWAPLTVPLVNVRATLVAAIRARVLSSKVARRMLELSADIFYQHRTWEALAAAWADDARCAPALVGFLAWLPTGVVDIKALDAEACLRAALRLMHHPPAAKPAPPDTVFTQALSCAVLKHGVRQNKV